VNGDTSHSNGGRRLLFPFLASIYRAIEPLTYFLVRVLAGLFFALHGAQKLFGWFGGDPAGETAAFARLGLEPAHLFMISSGWVEFGTGLLIAIGLFTRPAAAAATVLLTVAAFLLRANGFDWTHGGFEYSALWAAVCVMVLAKGGTSLSVDHAIGIEI
jgi:putative oxidoreductase